MDEILDLMVSKDFPTLARKDAEDLELAVRMGVMDESSARSVRGRRVGPLPWRGSLGSPSGTLNRPVTPEKNKRRRPLC